MRRPRAEELLPSADRWLLSWSDFVTLLLALFAAMYAGAMVDLAKAKLVAQSVGSAPGADQQGGQGTHEGPGASGKLGPPLAAPVAAANRQERIVGDVDQPALALMARLQAAMAGIAGGERVRIVHEAAGVGIDIDATLLFAPADARLAAQAEAALLALSGVLAHGSWQIMVEGHTDALPVHTSQFGSNWELSAMRAGVVARRLAEQGIANERLMAVGRADTRPLASNETLAGRATNRRVHLLVILGQDAGRATSLKAGQ